MTDYKLVPVEPTPEMVAALKARLTTTSRGGILNAGHALADAISTAPDVQGEPVATLLIGEPERTERGLELGDWDIAPNATAIEAFARLAGPGAYQLYLVPHPAEQQPAPDVAELVEALEWYSEQVLGCRKITSEGDWSRAALDRDGGTRARAALDAYRKQGGE